LNEKLQLPSREGKHYLSAPLRAKHPSATNPFGLSLRRCPGQKGAMTPAIASAIMPLMRGMDAETALGIALRALSLGLAGRDRGADHPSLATEVAGLRFRNPLGLAAGFDKNAEAVLPLLRLGFGFMEAGTVTPRPQAGNPRPRIFRLA